ncbi:MAG TPA: chromosome segregation protein SMC, partial [Chromatiales bacterium]|nr:chromosome segregation protein SMC [Chromatiales bacterium]
TDVIFNGSSSRKPVSHASVELVFDNSEGRAGGEFAKYNTISLKRQVNRDGHSLYELNGSKCRRKDITDLFLGTGLGSRSYAIIEQGTISRLVEAKPEELRIHIEEAAGISKYKERRRETENRIRHTRENLERLSDLRDELDKQLARLKRQARTAERYKVLKEEERLAKAQLQALRWAVQNDKAAASEQALRERETALEQAIARLRAVEADIEKHRSQQAEASDAHAGVQSRYYSVGADIARLEQSIQHARERRAQQQQDLAQLEKDGQDAREHLGADQQRITELEASLEILAPDLRSVEQQEQAASQALREAEAAMQEWQAEWDRFTQEAAEPARQADVERTRIQHLEQRLNQLHQRGEQLQKELAEQSPHALEQELGALTAQLAESEAAVEAAREALSRHQQQIGELRDATHQRAQQLDEARSELQDLRGRSASLEALQQAALGKEQGALSQWLSGQHLEDAPRLAEELNVEPGWERAAECVLGHHLEAVCVEGIDPLAQVLGNFDEGILSLFDTTARPEPIAADKGTPLESMLSAPWPLAPLLAGIYVADDLQQALAMRDRLAAHESVVTRDGIWLGNGWLRVVRDSDARAGILKREQELKQLAGRIGEVTARVAELQAQLESERTRLRELEAERERVQAAFNQANRRHAEQQSRLVARRGQMDQIRSRQAKLQTELNELRGQVEADQDALKAARASLETALEQMGGQEQQRDAMQVRRDRLQESLEVARGRAQEARNQAHEIKLQHQTLTTELNSTRQALERLQSQLEQVERRRTELEKALAESDAPLAGMGQELEQSLEKRVGVEAELGEARKRLETIEHELRQLDEARSRAEQDVQDVRSRLEQIRIGQQEVKVRRQTLEEQIRESGYELQPLLKEMPEEANEADWQARVETLEGKISRLGPINLAAIDEFEQQSERKAFLDAQNDDLVEALTTLENAIAKIDRETRTRFKETFDKVNAGMKELFPRLFGGGHAYLELTGDELLDAGVTVMARPPGKRNSTIHLLSGGEKALTAVALVFAIFHLNPAPFCMLDEVDAPLDDANVGRFCDMLKDMAEHTQFIFITHNKLTMEIAQHLTGVTMHEPGVSRLVAVDIDEAIELAAV